MLQFPTATFLGNLQFISIYRCYLFTDLGSNIGMFSVTVASMGRKVVAVDASIQNLAYIHKSVSLNGNRENVVLINNAVR